VAVEGSAQLWLAAVMTALHRITVRELHLYGLTIIIAAPITGATMLSQSLSAFHDETQLRVWRRQEESGKSEGATKLSTSLLRLLRTLCRLCLITTASVGDSAND
jgi:hypothetical protein